MKVKIAIDILINKEDRKMCDPYCIYNQYGSFCNLFNISHYGVNKRVRQCLLRKIIYHRKGK